jgi:branched-chain amino acid transport system ATP-binding protein
MIGGPLPKRGRWTIDTVYELFPRLAERRGVSGAAHSGGEQQTLAIGGALLTNPRLLVIDEPSEGLAPRVIEGLVETITSLTREGVGVQCS